MSQLILACPECEKEILWLEKYQCFQHHYPCIWWMTAQYEEIIQRIYGGCTLCQATWYVEIAKPLLHMSNPCAEIEI